METVKFDIIKCGVEIVRIVPRDIRTKFKKIADGGCITDLETMIAVMENITKKCEEMGVIASFEI